VISDTTTTATPSPHAATRATRVGRERDALLGLAEERMWEFLGAERARWLGVDERAGELIDAVAGLIRAGGKRLRPAFCLSGYLAAGGDASDTSVIPAAVALELLHACALIHDDVMDASPLRRGRRTVHAKYADEHNSRQWRGSPQRFGENVAILAGDLALVYADQIMAEAPPTVDAAWGELRSELIIGQYMDVAAAAGPSAEPDLSRWIAIVKSGRYTIHRPLVVGAVIAGRPELASVFEAYGAALGEAFQLRDDLLNVFGDDRVTGKPCGLDIEQYKMTLLLTLSIQRDVQVRDLMSGASPDPARLRGILAETGVRDDIEAHIGELVERGCQAIAEAPLDVEWRDELAAMAYKVAYRDN
jgi:geranylgeranyl diphosphate synthase, type I